MRAKASTRKGRSEEEEARGNVREGRTTRRTHQVTQDEEVHTPETPAPTQHSQNTPKTSEGGARTADACHVLTEKISFSHSAFRRTRRLGLLVPQRRRGFHHPPIALQSRSEAITGGGAVLPVRQQENKSILEHVRGEGACGRGVKCIEGLAQSPEKVPETPQIARGRSLSSAVRSLDWNKKDAEDEHKIFSVPANKFYGVPKAEDLKDTAFLVEIDGVFLRNEIYREILEQVTDQPSFSVSVSVSVSVSASFSFSFSVSFTVSVSAPLSLSSPLPPSSSCSLCPPSLRLIPPSCW
eukprot:748793-Hanusia_phi.AAC.1